MATPARVPGVPYLAGRNDYHDSDGRHYGIAIHNTSNNASDTDEANYAQRRKDGTSSHFYVDRDSVTQSLPLTDKAGHAGSPHGNENAIAFEIQGTNDKPRSWWLANVAWDRLGHVIAWIIRNDPDFAGFAVRRASVAEMKTNPKVRAFYAHDDMRKAWGHTTHTDPGPGFPWDRLFSAVHAGLAALDGRSAPTTPTTSPAAPASTWTEHLVHQLPTLKHGMTGTAVRRVQALLNVAGQDLTADGDFGDKTDAAVKAEQRQGGVPVDGVVGPSTYAVLLGVK